MVWALLSAAIWALVKPLIWSTLSEAQTMALNHGSPRYASPIVLDLNGDGISTVGLNGGVSFDINGTGQAQKTGWLSETDGLLVLDRNGNGSIDGGQELFGTATTLADGSNAPNGYAALAALDSNGDGKIDSADAVYSALRVWVDANGDGISVAGELHTLASLNIASISTTATASNAQQNGNRIGLTSSYTSTDGSAHASADVWFQTGAPTPGSPTASVASATAVPTSLSQKVGLLTGALRDFGARDDVRGRMCGR